jgi:hypothetical protein
MPHHDARFGNDASRLRRVMIAIAAAIRQAAG